MKQIWALLLWLATRCGRPRLATRQRGLQLLSLDCPRLATRLQELVRRLATRLPAPLPPGVGLLRTGSTQP